MLMLQPSHVAEQSSSQPEREHPPGAIYRLKPKPSPAAGANAAAFGTGVNPFTGRKLSEMDKVVEEMEREEPIIQQSIRKKRQIDQFLEEIKDRYNYQRRLELGASTYWDLKCLQGARSPIIERNGTWQGLFR